MKYIKKITLSDEMYTEKERKKIKKNYDKTYTNYTINNNTHK